MKTKVIHQVSLSDIGGVQRSFVRYLKYAQRKSSFSHEVYSRYDLINEFKNVKKLHNNLNKSILNKIKFIFFLKSKNHIIHFYNNLGSKLINKLLKILSCSNIIFHERGNVWNAKDEDRLVYRENASKAKIILVNSNASKIMLVKRFGINKNKIKIIYNGFFSRSFSYNNKNNRYSKKFCVGYLGRLETNKGVHTLIETAKILPQYKFFIGGTGTWEKKLKKITGKLKNIKFIGKVNNSLNYISKMDLIVVPSIREPLGNIIIESGFCKKPVIASNIDGIPEIIQNEVNGILINPTINLSFNELPKNSVPYPKKVVNPILKKLQDPKEIDPKKLAVSIVNLEKNYKLRRKYGKNLNETVKDKFCLEKYFQNLEDFYKKLHDH